MSFSPQFQCFAAVYFCSNTLTSAVLINWEESVDQSQTGGTKGPRGSAFVFSLTPWTCSSLLKSGNTQKSLRCHFTLTGAWTNVRGFYFCGRKRVRRSSYQTDVYGFLTSACTISGKRRLPGETLGCYYMAVIQTAFLLTFTLASKSLLAWHKHSALVAQIKTQSNILCFWRLLLCHAQKLKAKQNCSVLFSFNAIKLYHECNSLLTAEQLAIASHKAAHKNRCVEETKLGEQKHFSVHSRWIDVCNQQKHPNKLPPVDPCLETFLIPRLRVQISWTCTSKSLGLSLFIWISSSL